MAQKCEAKYNNDKNTSLFDDDTIVFISCFWCDLTIHEWIVIMSLRLYFAVVRIDA